MTRVEGENSRLRHYLARLHRKTFCYSKSVDMLRYSVRLLIHYLHDPSVLFLMIHTLSCNAKVYMYCNIDSTSFQRIRDTKLYLAVDGSNVAPPTIRRLATFLGKPQQAQVARVKHVKVTETNTVRGT
jgi:hypothetical protein